VRPVHLPRFRAAITLLAAFAVGCSSSGPSSQQLSDFVSGLQTSEGAIIATRRGGSPPAPNGGPNVTPTIGSGSLASVVAAGINLIRLRANSDFDTVFLQVIDDPLDGYYELKLPSRTSDITVSVKLASSIPEDFFQTVFTVALGNAVGEPASIANELKSAPSSVAVSGTSPALSAAQQFTATATFTDGSTSNVTDQAAWQSSNSGIAQVTSTGLVSGLAAGEADISATFGGRTGTQHVTISPPAASTFTVSGTVTDGTSGGRLPGVTIAIGSRTTTTDASGNYSLTGISGGSATVTASATGYITGEQAQTIAANTTVNFVLSRIDVSISIQNSPCFTGTANDPPSSPGASSCTFVGSAPNLESPTFQWTFRNNGNNAFVSASGASVNPVFSCSFSTGATTIQITATLVVASGNSMASANQSVTLMRRTKQCGT
jgi:hypothetical protein